MKNLILFAAAAALFFTGGMVVADSINGTYKGNPIVKVMLQGKELPVEDVPGQIVDGRTLVPLYFLKNLGYDLTWDPNKYSVDIKPTEQAVGRRKLTSEEIAKLADEVGYLLAYDKNNVPFKFGSGFIINKDGLMISAHHVISDASKLVYENYGTSTFTIPDFDNSTVDIMGITLGRLPENKGKTFAYLNYTTQLPQVGEKVYAIGNPGGKITVTDGLVQSINDDNGIKKIRHTAHTDHGSSGGVLLNEYGEAVGVTIEGDSATTVDGFAIPMMYVQQELDKMNH